MSKDLKTLLNEEQYLSEKITYEEFQQKRNIHKNSDYELVDAYAAYKSLQEEVANDNL